MIKRAFIFFIAAFLFIGCGSKDPGRNTSEENFSYTRISIEEQSGLQKYSNISLKPTIRLEFSHPVSSTGLEQYISIASGAVQVPLDFVLSNSGRTLSLQPKSDLEHLSKYEFRVLATFPSAAGSALLTPVRFDFYTRAGTKDQFPRVSDEELLTLVQKQTFKYFWEFGHSVSGMARERNTSGDVVTSGGTGFGVMAMLVAVERGFVTRREAYERVLKITDFLKKADRFHGAFPHWLNGNSGKTVPFSQKDNGADLVETSLLIQGLLTASEYFSDANEKALRENVKELWEEVEWDWFSRGGDVLYWHWSPEYGWDMNLPIRGWNECLITYVLAASSPTHPISKDVYERGYVQSSGFKNGHTYFGIRLPLGEEMGGPLFFSHYSFLGLNPFGLKDSYASYEEQVVNHSRINHEYCKANPKKYAGYSEECWGLTASDNHQGYSAHSPTNDLGVISPTAALSSFPYTPEASMKALHFFYYKLGDKLWGDYGFNDAFNLSEVWFASSYLAIDQGPVICMIENYRTGLLWKLFMKNTEVHKGLNKLGFTYAESKSRF